MDTNYEEETLAEGKCFKSEETEIYIKVNNANAILFKGQSLSKNDRMIYSEGEELPVPTYFNKITEFNMKKEYTLKKINKLKELQDFKKSKNDIKNKEIPKETLLDIVNKRIKKEICYKTIHELTDEKLICDYKECKSVKKEIEKFGKILDKYLSEETKQKIINEYLLELIPAGTKGVIRGNKFNKIIKQYISNLELDKDRFEVCFEKKCKTYFTTEIPDWYILEKQTNKIILGMNQLDLWNGGQQLNRGSKYIENNIHNTDKSKLLCVVCNDIQFKTETNKAFKLFTTGFKNDTLCYINKLKDIIISYFN